jgi:hypothetical protein
MSWFGKKKDEIVDFTFLHKRGLLKNEEKEDGGSEVVDFRPVSGSEGYLENMEMQVSVNPSGENFPDLGFLSGLAQAEENPEEKKGTPVPIFKDDSELMMNEMKIRLEDSEYKIEALEEKIKELERKLQDKN